MTIFKDALTREQEALEKAKRKSLAAKEKRLNMIRDYLAQVMPVVQNQLLPRAIIVDMDGTLAHMRDHRKFSEWDKVGLDEIDEVVRDIVNMEAERGTIVIISSGRSDVCASVTAFWLREHGVHFDHIFMRKHGDGRPDIMVKFEIFMEEIFPNFFVKYSLDDRQQVVDLFRKLGIKCLQVEPSPAD